MAAPTIKPKPAPDNQNQARTPRAIRVDPAQCQPGKALAPIADLQVKRIHVRLYGRVSESKRIDDVCIRAHQVLLSAHPLNARQRAPNASTIVEISRVWSFAVGSCVEDHANQAHNDYSEDDCWQVEVAAVARRQQDQTISCHRVVLLTRCL